MKAFADTWYRIAIVIDWQRFTQRALAVMAEEYRALMNANGGRQ